MSNFRRALQTVTDTLPSGVTFGSATSTQGSCSESGGTITCIVGALNNGATVTVTIVVTPTAAGTITNTAEVRGNESDPNTANNTDSEETTVNVQADLSLAKADNPDAVAAGETLTYTLTISNTGSSDATGLTVTDTLPSGVTLVSATPTQSSGPNPLVSNLGNLAAGGSTAITVVVTVDSSTRGTITNTATVAANEFDPNTANNTDSEPTTVNAEADLAISKSDDPEPVVAGETLTYTLVYTNHGPSDAQGVTITDTLPVSVTYGGMVSVTPSLFGPTQTGQLLTWYTSTLAAEVSGTIVFTVTVDAGASGTITNSVVITSTIPDPDTSDNTASEPTTVTNQADLAISKMDSSDPVIAGNTLT